jgi:hypothetical protein
VGSSNRKTNQLLEKELGANFVFQTTPNAGNSYLHPNSNIHCNYNTNTHKGSTFKNPSEVVDLVELKNKSKGRVEAVMKTSSPSPVAGPSAPLVPYIRDFPSTATVVTTNTTNTGPTHLVFELDLTTGNFCCTKRLEKFDSSKFAHAVAIPEHTPREAALKRRPRAWIMVKDAPFFMREKLILELVGHLATRTKLFTPEFICRGGIAVIKGKRKKTFYVCLDTRQLLLTDKVTTRIRPNWFVDEASWINSVLTSMDSPINVAVTTDTNARGRKTGVRFIFTAGGAKQVVETGEFAIHKLFANE